MKCPKCGYTSFDYLDSCKKCQNSLSGLKEKFGLRSIIFPSRFKASDPATEPGEGGLPEVPEDATDFGYDILDDDTPATAAAAQAATQDDSASDVSSSAGSESTAADDETFDLGWSENDEEEAFPGFEEDVSASPADSSGSHTPGVTEFDFSEEPPEQSDFGGQEAASESDDFDFSFDDEEVAEEGASPAEVEPKKADTEGFRFDFNELDDEPGSDSQPEPEPLSDVEETSGAEDSFGDFDDSSELSSGDEGATSPPESQFDPLPEFSAADFGEEFEEAPSSEAPADLEPPELPGEEEIEPAQEIRQSAAPAAGAEAIDFDELSELPVDDPSEKDLAQENDQFASAFDELDEFEDLEFSEEELREEQDEESSSGDEKGDPRDPFDRKEVTSVGWPSETDSDEEGQYESTDADAAPGQEEKDQTPSPVVRIAAAGVDLGLLAGVLMLFFWAGQKLVAPPGQSDLFPPLQTVVYLATPYFLVLFITHFVYFTLFHYLAGQTPGKMLFHLRVEDESGGGISAGQAFLRSVGGLASVLCLGAGFLSAFRAGGLTWNDRLAGTRIAWSLDELEGDSELRDANP